LLWSLERSYHPEPFGKESELEEAIREVEEPLFGRERIYLEVKKLIGQRGKTQNVPDAYLIDLSSPKRPRLWVVENELASHDPLKHIAVQVLEMSLSFESTPQRLKSIVKEALGKTPEGWGQCEEYARSHGFSNIDYLLEEMIYRGEFGALVIIDELHDELETLLVSHFKFGVEVLTLNRYRDGDGERLYQFEPFLTELAPSGESFGAGAPVTAGKTVDTSEIDTVVVPAREEGFRETLLGEDRWYKVRLQTSMIPKIKHLAVYRVSPVSAITHVAPVESIEPWPNIGKYVLNFSEPARELERPLKLVSGGKVRALQNLRYTSYERLMNAKNMEEAF
jgi:hypothetical protein